eukprot:gene36897-45518_t
MGPAVSDVVVEPTAKTTSESTPTANTESGGSETVAQSKVTHNGADMLVSTHAARYSGERNSWRQRHGQGRQTYLDGTCVYYEGQWKSNKRHGHGEMEIRKSATSPGGVYVGSFQSDRAHGHGVHTYDNGDVYIGMWREGLRHGQ